MQKMYNDSWVVKIRDRVFRLKELSDKTINIMCNVRKVTTLNFIECSSKCYVNKYNFFLLKTHLFDNNENMS